jgi:hypothetical protein
MRRDIHHWQRALELAQAVAPDELPLIAKEVFGPKLIKKPKILEMHILEIKKSIHFKNRLFKKAIKNRYNYLENR